MCLCQALPTAQGVPFSLSLWQTLSYVSGHSLPTIPALCSFLKPLPAPSMPLQPQILQGRFHVGSAFPSPWQLPPQGPRQRRTCSRCPANVRSSQTGTRVGGRARHTGRWHQEPTHTCSHLRGTESRTNWDPSPQPVGSATKSSNSSPPPQKTENSIEHKRQNNPVGHTPTGARLSKGGCCRGHAPLLTSSPPVSWAGLAWLMVGEEPVLQLGCVGSLEGRLEAVGLPYPSPPPKPGLRLHQMGLSLVLALSLHKAGFPWYEPRCGERALASPLLYHPWWAGGRSGVEVEEPPCGLRS